LLDAVADHRPPFLVLEHLRGPSLEEALEARRRFPAEEVRAIGAALASALAALHDRDVVHRDVKPANVLVVPDRGPVLVDLGLAYELGGEDLTRTGAVLGTPAYLPPEVFGLERATSAADIFGLGTLLHELMVGERPFSARDLVRAGEGAGLPAAPADTLTDLLGPVAGRALAAAPEARPSALELAEALAGASDRATLEGIETRILAESAARAEDPAPSRVLSSEDVRITRELGSRRTGRHAAVSPRPRPAAAPGTALAVLALGFGLASFFGRPATRIPPPPPPTLGGAPPPRVGPPPQADERPTLALGLRLTPYGVALYVDGTDPPDRVRFLNGDERWTVPARPVPSGAVYPVGRTLDGHRPLQAEPLRRSASGAYRSLAPPDWWRQDLEPRVTRLEATRDELMRGPYTPREAGGPEAAPPPIPWTPDPAAVLVRTAIPLHPGLILAELGDSRLAWGVLTDQDGTWLKGVPLEESDRGTIWPLPPGRVAASGAGLVALDGALGLLTRTSRDRGAPWRWQVLRDGVAGPEVDLSDHGFEPTVGPLPRPEGGAAWLDAYGRVMVADPDGSLRPPPAPSGDRFLRRAGYLHQTGRYAVVAGILGDGPGLVVVDLAKGAVVARVRDVPGLGPGHPVVVGPSGSEVVTGLAGDQLFRVPLEALLRAGAAAPVTPWSTLSVELVPKGGALPEPRSTALAWPRAEAASTGEHGALLRLALHAPPAGGVPAALARADYLRWALQSTTPGVAERPLDVGPFPVVGPARHQGMLAIGEDGSVATLVETAADRWVLEVGRLDDDGPSQVRWTLGARAGLRSPTLVPGAVLVETWRKVLRFPLPWVSTVTE
jgi:hypothetical protein